MIVLFSNNEKVIQRWKDILNESYSLLSALSFKEFFEQLNNNPDLLIIHETALGDNYIEKIKELIMKFEKKPFIVLSDKPDEHAAFKLIHSGAYGYSNTYISPRLLRDAVKQILKGEAWMSKRLTRYLSECLLEDLNDEECEDTAIDVEQFMTKLSIREKEVAVRIAHGCSNKCIANKLNITERTVKAHISSVFEKTGIRDRVHLALILSSHKYD